MSKKSSKKTDEPKFYELSEESINSFYEVFNKKIFPLSLRFQFLGAKQDCLIKLTRLADKYVFLMEKDILVEINEEIFEAFDAESITILIEQEIDKIFMDGNSGKIKLIKPDLSTFSAIINKYGVDKVARANQVQELYDQQSKDDDFLI